MTSDPRTWSRTPHWRRQKLTIYRRGAMRSLFTSNRPAEAIFKSPATGKEESQHGQGLFSHKQLHYECATCTIRSRIYCSMSWVSEWPAGTPRGRFWGGGDNISQFGEIVKHRKQWKIVKNHFWGKFNKKSALKKKCLIHFGSVLSICPPTFGI